MSNGKSIGPPEIRDVDPEARYFTPHPREIASSINNLGAVLAIVGFGRPVAIAGIAT